MARARQTQSHYLAAVSLREMREKGRVGRQFEPPVSCVRRTKKATPHRRMDGFGVGWRCPPTLAFWHALASQARVTASPIVDFSER